MGYDPPSFRNTTPSFSSSPPPLKSANWPSPTPRFFRRFPPIYCFFVNTPPPKNRVFQWTLIIFKFFILTPSHLLKVTKFLVKISQFKFLLMTEKNIFVGKLFLSLNISDFSLCKNCTSTEKIHPLLSQESPSKNWDAVKPSPLLKIWSDAQPPSRKGGWVYTMKAERSSWNVSLKHRSSCLEVFCKKDVFRNFPKFTGKHLCNFI